MSDAPPQPFPIIRVDVPPAERRDEQLGSKAKFWYTDASGNDVLYKRGRENEDWSEKAAAELARLLHLPCARIELADCGGERGTVSYSFLDRTHGERLVHGNELLMSVHSSYPAGGRYHVPQHTVEAVGSALQHFAATQPACASYMPPDFDGVAVFVGYLLLDAWIGNSDRHHENWGVIVGATNIVLAPTFDHASSLGRNDPVEKTRKRLGGRDPFLTVAGYASKCRSAFYGAESNNRPLLTIEAFERAAASRPRAGEYWQGRLSSVSDHDIEHVLAAIPKERIDDVHREFAVRILGFNRKRLLGVETS